MQVNPYQSNALGFSSIFGAARPSQQAALGRLAQEAVTGNADEDARLKTEALASELVRRLEQNGPGAQKTGEETKRDTMAGSTPQALASALAGAARFMRESFGNDASTAFMGIMAKGVGEGAVGEEAMGRAMLEAVRFTDRNFGFAAGDKVMAHLNGGLNRAVNDYFDNGLNETLYAGRPGGGAPAAVSRAIDSALAPVAERFGADAADAVKGIIEDSLGSGGPGGLRNGLKDAVAYLEKTYGAEAELSGIEETLAGVQTLRSTGPGAPPPPKGMLLSAAV